MAKLSAFARQVDIAKTTLLGPARQAFMAKAAREAFADAMAVNTRILGHAPEWEQFVDGNKGAALESVKPRGIIIYLFDVAATTLRIAVNDTLKELRRISPVDDPAHDDVVYKDSHVVLVNNVGRAYGLDYDIGELDQSAEVQITNLLPYARRIERKIKRLGRAWSAQAPDGVYEVAYAAIKARYGGILYTHFTYEYFPGFLVGKTKAGGTPVRPTDIRRSSQYPTIVLRAK